MYVGRVTSAPSPPSPVTPLYIYPGSLSHVEYVSRAVLRLEKTEQTDTRTDGRHTVTLRRDQHNNTLSIMSD